jgi:hypothetical protein
MQVAIYERCVRAYRRDCEREGAIFQQPTGGIFILTGDNGPLAVYRLHEDGFGMCRIPPVAASIWSGESLPSR